LGIAPSACHDDRVNDVGPGQSPDDWSSGARGYDEAFARYTGEYAEDAIEFLRIGPGQRVLDVAAGSGAFALRAALCGAEVVAVDFAPGMVELLRELADDQGLPMRVEQMDGQALEFADGEFDAACSMFGLMFFADLDRGLRELARVTRAGGRAAVGVWDLGSSRLADVVYAAFATAAPDFTPPEAAITWASIGDPEGLAGAMTNAGLADVEVHDVRHGWRFDDPVSFFRGMPEWAPPVRPIFAAAPAAAIAAAADAFAADVAPRAGGLTFTALIGIGTRA
jgi:SAM-dependent methyltransferase